MHTYQTDPVEVINYSFESGTTLNCYSLGPENEIWSYIWDENIETLWHPVAQGSTGDMHLGAMGVQTMLSPCFPPNPAQLFG